MASGYKKGAPVKASSRTGRHGESDSKACSHGAQVQNVKAARVYVFGDDDIAEEEETVEFEMRSRGKGSSTPGSTTFIEETPQVQYFEKEIQDGETLQAIALKYACQVSELKRLNNLIQDQDFFALRVLKVPMTRYGILSEQVARGELGIDHKQLSQHANGAMFAAHSGADMSSSYRDESDSQHDFSDPDMQLKVMRTLSIRENFSEEGREAEKFLRKMDADLKKLKQSSTRSSDQESLNEVISMLTNKSIHPLQTSNSRRITNGADCGLTFRNIVVVCVAVAIIVPLVVGLVTLYYGHDSESGS
ncbi:lysM and putative peptidoglycan-binding domain-containing protein 3 [Aplysia californica]|uniref:LysM and putative peptidoglycan-binding domain-containing protein 3 n=1 Tax=Aplysia californica TaxID=6500 RepID=A0ABM0JSC2_APLCA|nr:lysM and putative peptidoglycan-binding domain-containing protein 3 [Aplysia californica]